MGLRETIGRCRTYLEKGFIKNEASVRQHIINPILSDLGWDDPSCIQPEFNVEGLKADYALLDDGGVKFFIEAKKPDVDLSISGLTQLFAYAVRGKQAPLLALTNGAEWQFYLTYKPGYGIEERIFASLDLRNKSDENINRLVEAFSKYLNRDDVLSGAAYEVAETDFERHKKLEHAKGEFRKWWNAQLKDPSEELANSAKEIFATEHNVAPELDTETIQELIKNPPLSQSTSTSVVEEIRPSYQSTSRSSAQVLKVTYHGKEYNEGRATQRFVAVLRDIGPEDAYRACRKANITYSGKSLIMKEQDIRGIDKTRWRKISGEYWVNTNSTTPKKCDQLKQIALACGISHLLKAEVADVY